MTERRRQALRRRRARQRETRKLTEHLARWGHQHKRKMERYPDAAPNKLKEKTND